MSYSFKYIYIKTNMLQQNETLEAYILRLNDAYYNKVPLVSDSEYDLLVEKLNKLNPMNDLNTNDLEKAVLIIKGTAKSMGITVN